MEVNLYLIILLTFDYNHLTVMICLIFSFESFWARAQKYNKIHCLKNPIVSELKYLITILIFVLENPELISNQTSFIFVKFRSKGWTRNLWTIISLEHAVLSSWNTSSSQSPKSIRSITPKLDAFVLVEILSKTMSCYR